MMDDDYPPPHPLADKLTPPTWDGPGECVCGAVLPPMSAWDSAGRDWSNILCSACGCGFVDEGDYIAIYDREAVEEHGGPGTWRVHS